MSCLANQELLETLFEEAYEEVSNNNLFTLNIVPGSNVHVIAKKYNLFNVLQAVGGIWRKEPESLYKEEPPCLFHLCRFLRDTKQGQASWRRCR